jgi:hypothetical protein
VPYEFGGNLDTEMHTGESHVKMRQRLGWNCVS